MLSRVLVVLDALVFSGLWPAAVAGALIAASGVTLGLAGALVLQVATLGFAGTLCVYNVDRLRDVERDAHTAPDRSRFVRAHQPALRVLAGSGAFVAAALAAGLPTPAVGLCALVLVLGLLHRRLKAWPGFKALYVTGAWLAIAVGVPALVAGPVLAAPRQVGWTTALVGSALGANLIASNARPIGRMARRPATHFVALAIAVAAAGASAACFAPTPLRPLGWIPGAECAALAGVFARRRQRLGQRYGPVVVDGALLFGALAALALVASSAGRVN